MIGGITTENINKWLVNQHLVTILAEVKVLVQCLALRPYMSYYLDMFKLYWYQ